MPFRLTHTIPNVKQFDHSGDSLLFLDRNGNVIRKTNNSETLIARNIDSYRLAISSLFCFTETENMEVYKNDILIKQFDGPLFSMAFYDNVDSAVVLKELNDGDRFFRIDELLSMTPFAWNNNFLTDVKGRYFFSKHGQSLTCHLLSNGEQLWNLDICSISSKKDDRIVSRLIVHGKKLFFTLLNGVVVCVDIESGRVLDKIAFGKGWIKLHNDLIYGVNDKVLGVLNPYTLQFENVDLSEELNNNDLTFSWNLFIPEGNELYFIDDNHQKESATRKVAVLDLSCRETVWQTEIPIEDGSYWINEIVVQQGKLYILTQGGTLRVFQKEYLTQ